MTRCIDGGSIGRKKMIGGGFLVGNSQPFPPPQPYVNIIPPDQPENLKPASFVYYNKSEKQYRQTGT
jgi:hypothetical protein